TATVLAATGRLPERRYEHYAIKLVEQRRCRAELCAIRPDGIGLDGSRDPSPSFAHAARAFAVRPLGGAAQRSAVGDGTTDLRRDLSAFDRGALLELVANLAHRHRQLGPFGRDLRLRRSGVDDAPALSKSRRVRPGRFRRARVRRWIGDTF